MLYSKLDFTIFMFISLISEFVLGYYGSYNVVRFDVAIGLLGLGASIISELSASVADLNELRVEDAEDSIGEVDALIELVSVTLSLLTDVLAAGQSSEGFTPVLEIIATLSDALSLITDIAGICGRGFGGFALLAEGTSVIDSGLVTLELISTVLRPISLALRIFANLTSGVLISSLAASGSTSIAIGSLTTTTLGAAETTLAVLTAVSVLLSAFETVVGIIQSYVYYILCVQYFRTTRV